MHLVGIPRKKFGRISQLPAQGLAYTVSIIINKDRRNPSWPGIQDFLELLQAPRFRFRGMFIY
ncbi:MAG: hypothetical protein NPIRA03_09090 [Nitrospirales bacterium]|nr:MAG: hypothetical protein NPIRA03_09090 [Nitrospirales bacterium]